MSVDRSIDFNADGSIKSPLVSNPNNNTLNEGGGVNPLKLTAPGPGPGVFYHMNENSPSKNIRSSVELFPGDKFVENSDSLMQRNASSSTSNSPKSFTKNIEVDNSTYEDYNKHINKCLLECVGTHEVTGESDCNPQSKSVVCPQGSRMSLSQDSQDGESREETGRTLALNILQATSTTTTQTRRGVAYLGAFSCRKTMRNVYDRLIKLLEPHGYHVELLDSKAGLNELNRGIFYWRGKEFMTSKQRNNKIKRLNRLMDGLKKYNLEHNIDVSPSNIGMVNVFSTGIGIGAGYDKHSKQSVQSNNTIMKHHQQQKHNYNQPQSVKNAYQNNKAYHHGSSNHTSMHKAFHLNGGNNPTKNHSHQPQYRHSTNNHHFVDQHYSNRFSSQETSHHPQQIQSAYLNHQVSVSPLLSGAPSSTTIGGQQHQYQKYIAKCGKNKSYSNRTVKTSSQLNAFSAPFRQPQQQYRSVGLCWDAPKKQNTEVNQSLDNVTPAPSNSSTSLGSFAATSATSSVSSTNSNLYNRE